MFLRTCSQSPFYQQLLGESSSYNNDSAFGFEELVRLCLDDICTPNTLNMDLGDNGVRTGAHSSCVQSLTLDKVYPSFVMQSGITIGIFIALLALQALPVHGKTS